ncbi:MAG: hypothetical protein GKR92_10215 [Gammaproteobacteria bacterium]|nr:MAG: hypothetical protein GKR92_10215 [Gammaproteobacteria bacterium]
MKYFMYLILISIGFCGGIYVGFQKAPQEFIYWDSQYKASILASQQKLLKNGNVEKAIDANEIFLNNELSNHAEFLESKLKWLLPNRLPFDRKPIQNAVDYRLANPYQLAGLSSSSSIEEIEGDKILNKNVNFVLELYRKASSE